MEEFTTAPEKHQVREPRLCQKTCSSPRIRLEICARTCPDSFFFPFAFIEMTQCQQNSANFMTKLWQICNGRMTYGNVEVASQSSLRIACDSIVLEVRSQTPPRRDITWFWSNFLPYAGGGRGDSRLLIAQSLCFHIYIPQAKNAFRSTLRCLQCGLISF